LITLKNPVEIWLRELRTDGELKKSSGDKAYRKLGTA